MVALGSQGQPERWFGPALENGVHLRWLFRPELGFPFGGFSLYRRAHLAGTLIELGGAAPPSIVFPETARRVVAEFENPLWRSPSGRPPHPLPSLTGLYETVPVAVNSAHDLKRPRAIFSMENDALDAVRIEAPGQWRLERLRYVPVSQGADTRWEEL